MPKTTVKGRDSSQASLIGPGENVLLTGPAADRMYGDQPQIPTANFAVRRHDRCWLPPRDGRSTLTGRPAHGACGPMREWRKARAPLENSSATHEGFGYQAMPAFKSRPIRPPPSASCSRISKSSSVTSREAISSSRSSPICPNWAIKLSTLPLT